MLYICQRFQNIAHQERLSANFFQILTITCLIALDALFGYFVMELLTSVNIRRNTPSQTGYRRSIFPNEMIE